jgi:hypothetical protein
MNRSLSCDHCGASVRLDTRTDPQGMRLVTHLLGHRDLLTFDEPPRWAELLAHFHVAPQPHPLSGRGVQA